jgi:hypothetical protein
MLSGSPLICLAFHSDACCEHDWYFTNYTEINISKTGRGGGGGCYFCYILRWLRFKITLWHKKTALKAQAFGPIPNINSTSIIMQIVRSVYSPLFCLMLRSEPDLVCPKLTDIRNNITLFEGS